MLLLGERIDEWVMGQIEGFEGKRFKDAARGDLELGRPGQRGRPRAHDAERKESKGLLKRVKDALGERVLEVRVSDRLSDSPACLVLGEDDLHRADAAHAGGRRPEGAGGAAVLELNVAIRW